jgi:hypothetical protein
MAAEKKCKFCGLGPFNWKKTVSGWRLMDPKTGELHQCRATKTALITKAIELGLNADVANSMRLRDLQQWIEQQNPDDASTPAPEAPQEPEVIEPKTAAAEKLELPEGVEHVHPNYWTALAFFKAVPSANQWWAGPAGSGKTTLASNIAKALGKTFVHIAISKNTAEFDLFGYMDGHGRYVPGKAYEALRGKDKLVLIDECDRGNDGVLVSWNAILDQRYVVFPNGERVEIDPSIYFVATGNTWGRGADAVYTAAGALDAAFLDRFQIKLAHDYDEDFELAITENKRWTRYVQRVRKAVFDLRLQGVVIGPRASRDGGKAINGGIPWNTVEQTILWSSIPVELQASVKAKLAQAA